MKKINWGGVEAASGNFAAPPAGGYILAICAVEDFEQKEYLKIYYDIAGVADKANEQFVGYYGQRKERSNGRIPLASSICSYRETAQGYFKAFLVALEKSGNANFVADRFDNNEQQFCGMVIGAVLGAEEYEYGGKVCTRLKVDHFCSVASIQKGNFKIPELKKLAPAAVSTTSAAPSNSSYVPFSNVGNDELPF